VKIIARIFGLALPVKWKIFIAGTIPNKTGESFLGSVDDIAVGGFDDLF